MAGYVTTLLSLCLLASNAPFGRAASSGRSADTKVSLHQSSPADADSAASAAGGTEHQAFSPSDSAGAGSLHSSTSEAPLLVTANNRPLRTSRRVVGYERMLQDNTSDDDYDYDYDTDDDDRNRADSDDDGESDDDDSDDDGGGDDGDDDDDDADDAAADDDDDDDDDSDADADNEADDDADDDDDYDHNGSIDSNIDVSNGNSFALSSRSPGEDAGEPPAKDAAAGEDVADVEVPTHTPAADKSSAQGGATPPANQPDVTIIPNTAASQDAGGGGPRLQGLSGLPPPNSEDKEPSAGPNSGGSSSTPLLTSSPPPSPPTWQQSYEHIPAPPSPLGSPAADDSNDGVSGSNGGERDVQRPPTSDTGVDISKGDSEPPSMLPWVLMGAGAWFASAGVAVGSLYTFLWLKHRSTGMWRRMADTETCRIVP